MLRLIGSCLLCVALSGMSCSGAGADGPDATEPGDGTGAAEALVAGPCVAIHPTAIVFTRSCARPKQSQSIAIQACGTKALRIEETSLEMTPAGEPFDLSLSMLPGGLPSILQPGEEATQTLTCEDSTKGQGSAVLRVSTDAADPIDVPISFIGGQSGCPEVLLSADATSPATGTTVTLDGSGTCLLGGAIGSYRWTVTRPGLAPVRLTDGGPTAKVAIDRPGAWRICLDACGPELCSDDPKCATTACADLPATGDPAGPIGEHRAAAEACASGLAPRTATCKHSRSPGAGAQDACATDADCTGTDARCLDAYDPGAGGGTTCQCFVPACAKDDDCADGELCLCGVVQNEPGDPCGGFFGDPCHHRCVPAACRVDADCGADGWCAPARDACGWQVERYACHRWTDACLQDLDCGPNAVCRYGVAGAKWSCEESPVCG